MKKILCFLLLLHISLYSQNTYYEDKLSQFKLLNDNKKINITMLGDSITDRGLWSELMNRNDISNRGINGDTTNGLLHRTAFIGTYSQQIFIMIGINDIAQHNDVEMIFSNYINILQKLKEMNYLTYVQSTLYVGNNFSSKTINTQVTQLNKKLHDYCLKNEIEFIDLNTILAPNNFLDTKFTNDGVHLNGLAYQLWADTIKKYFMQ